MDYIQQFLYIAQDNMLLSLIAGILSAFIESFIPALPIVAIVGANAAIHGMFIGLLISWIGSGLGTLSLFLILSRFNDNKIFRKMRTEKVEAGVRWLDKKGFSMLFIAYACTFMPSSLATVASAFCKKKFIDFAPPMLAGKFVMFIVVSYVAEDISGFIHSPLKIIVLIALVALSWFVGKKANVNLEKHELEIEKKKKEMKNDSKKTDEKK